MDNAIKQSLDELIQQLDLGLIRDWIFSSITPGHQLQFLPPSDTPIPVGTSRAGGDPDLPANAQWPGHGETPDSFMAQINLAELPEQLDSPLPKTGLLSFFMGSDESRVNVEGSILYTPSDEKLERRPFPGDAEEISDYYADLTAHALKATTAWTLPYINCSTEESTAASLSWSLEYYHSVDYGDLEHCLDNLYRVRNLLFNRDYGQMLGHANDVDNPPQEIVALEFAGLDLYDYDWRRENAQQVTQLASQWQLLFRIPSYFGWTTFWDFYSLAYYIRQTDLQNMDFTSPGCLLLRD